MRADGGLYTDFRWGFTGEPQEMLVENGRVKYRRTANNQQPTTTNPKPTSLGGRYLLPSFIDAHCHILPTGLDLEKLHLGKFSTKQEILDAVRDEDKRLPEGKWLMAVHYDQTKFSDGKHLTIQDLDLISRKRPIILRHVSGHASVANSATLEVAGITDETPDPSGGTIERDASGRATGVLLENAHERVTGAAPVPTLGEMVSAIMAAGDSMASCGISCASDMMTGRFDLLRELEAYRLAAERGCKIRTRLYVQWSAMFGPRATSKAQLVDAVSAMNPETCRVAGVKIFADGAIGSATAAIYGSYTGHPPSHSLMAGAGRKQATADGVSGQLIYEPDTLKDMVRKAHEAGYQVAIHSIGDYATDLVIDAFEATGEPSRHRIEHAMLLSDAQIERIAKRGIHCTMQPEFLLRFGHAYRRQLGEERASSLKRFRSVLDAGIPLSFNSDRPIVAGNPLDGLRAACHRPDGFDQSENVTPTEALLAYTEGGAVSNEDSEIMGSLLRGQVADFLTFDTDPLTQQA